MHEQPTSAEPTSSSEGRESNGRFAKGNRGGPGNPFARQTAAFRATLQRKVTERDIEEIADRLIADAKAGDNTATKLLFQYVIGKPQPATDPDKLDVDEFRGLQEAAVPPEVFAAMLRCVPLALLLQLWPLLIEAKTSEVAGLVQETCARADDKDRRRQERAAKKAARRQRRRDKREQARQATEPAAAPSPNPVMWVEVVSSRDGASPSSPRGAFLGEPREEIGAGHGVPRRRRVASPPRQRGTSEAHPNRPHPAR